MQYLFIWSYVVRLLCMASGFPGLMEASATLEGGELAATLSSPAAMQATNKLLSPPHPFPVSPNYAMRATNDDVTSMFVI